MCSLRRKLRFRLEIMLVKLGMAVVPVMPRAWVRGLAAMGGTLAYWLAPGLRRLALTNLELALRAEVAPALRGRLARRAFRNFALVFLDFFWFSRQTAARLRRYVRVDPWLREGLRQFPTIGVTAHFGNWELLAQAFAMDGVPVAAVAAPLANPEVDDAFGRFRADGGVRIIPKQGAVRQLLRTLRAGGNVALLLDQNVKLEDGGIFVNFFGLPIPMSTAAAVLAERTGTCITMVFCEVEPGGFYRLYALPVWCVWRAPGEDVELVRRETTQRIASLFEAEIRRHPDQWLWMYKRWKHVAPGMPRAAYPYYAKVREDSAHPNPPTDG